MQSTLLLFIVFSIGQAMYSQGEKKCRYINTHNLFHLPSIYMGSDWKISAALDIVLNTTINNNSRSVLMRRIPQLFYWLKNRARQVDHGSAVPWQPGGPSHVLGSQAQLREGIVLLCSALVQPHLKSGGNFGLYKVRV